MRNTYSVALIVSTGRNSLLDPVGNSRNPYFR
jgi:hypothetical protein